jgi:hypothetical protein
MIMIFVMKDPWCIWRVFLHDHGAGRSRSGARTTCQRFVRVYPDKALTDVGDFRFHVELAGGWFRFANSQPSAAPNMCGWGYAWLRWMAGPVPPVAGGAGFPSDG